MLAQTEAARQVAAGRPGVRYLSFAAVPGAVAWVVMTLAAAPGWVDATPIDLLICFGLLCVVPLGFVQVRRLGVHVPLGRLVAERSRRPRTLLPLAALAYLGVGAGWLFLSALGARPLGFSGAIVQLTAVHFHFAGFAAPLVAAATGEALQARRPRLAAVARGGGFGVVAAMPLVAAGFVVSPVLSAAGAILLAASLGAVAVVMLPVALEAKGVPGIMLGVASVSVLGAMVLALGNAVLGLPAPHDPPHGRDARHRERIRLLRRSSAGLHALRAPEPRVRPLLRLAARPVPG